MNDQDTNFFLVPTPEATKDNYEGVLKFFAMQLEGSEDQEMDLLIRTNGKNCSCKAWYVHDRCTAIALIERAYDLFKITLRVVRLYIGAEYAEFCPA